MPEFNCDLCKYKSTTKAGYDQHCKTKKHLTMAGNKPIVPVQQPKIQEVVPKLQNQVQNRQLDISNMFDKVKTETKIDSLERRIKELEEKVKKLGDTIEQQYNVTTNNISVTFPYITDMETDEQHCRSVEELRELVGEDAFKLLSCQMPLPGFPPQGFQGGPFSQGMPLPPPDLSKLVPGYNFDTDSDDEPPMPKPKSKQTTRKTK